MSSAQLDQPINMASIFENIKTADPVALTLVFATLIVFVIPIFILFPPLPVESFDVLGQTHSKIGISPKKSNLPRNVNKHPASTGTPKIESLWIYPVKSCTGIEMQRSNVLPSGLEFDRLYTFAMLEEGQKGRGEDGQEVWRFQTLRQLPLLANVKVDIWLPDESKTSRALGRIRDGFIVVKFPWASPGWKGKVEILAAKLSRGWEAMPQKEFLLPLDFPSEEEQRERGYEFQSVKIWNETPKALEMGREVPRELSEYLGVKKGKLGLFRMDPLRQRKVFRNAPKESDVGYQPVVDFHDAYPLHLLTLESLADLESKVEKDADLDYLDPRRFRANIITSGSTPFDEETWRLIRCTPPSSSPQDAINFDISARMVRCKLPNVNPETGIKHRVEPDKAMRKFRAVDEGAPRMGCFGMSLCPVFERPDERLGVVEVGMEVEVKERGEHLYIDM